MTAPSHPAFDLLSASMLPEFRANGFWYRHRATGCEIYHLRSEDEENTFAFCFATPSRDSSGVAHIVEHSVLCGSRRFPVKDAFLSLARGSLQSFMNAFTYPDKTVYPAASTVKADYFNLMEVYGDAVFFPILSEETFLQEAHHLEYGEDGKLLVKGVVYNEMRGDYASAESFVGTIAMRSLFSAGHPYSFDSGGDPELIPSLTRESFNDFHASRYHPSNCRIFLHGNIDSAEQLEFLESRFLSGFGTQAPEDPVPRQPRFVSPLRIAEPFAVDEGSDAKTSILVNWLVIPYQDDPIALEAVSEVLIGHDGAPLAKALLESGLGEDLSPHCGLDTGLREALFTAGLRGIERGREAELEAVCADIIGKVVGDGIAREELDAALHGIVFANREIRRGSGTYGLRLFGRSIRGWLNGAGPEGTLSFERAYSLFRRSMDANPRYLEDRMSEWLLSNPHRTTVTVYPEPGLLPKRAAAERKRLDELDLSFSAEERLAIRHRASALEEFQNLSDGPELASLVPSLARSDIPTEIDIIPRVQAESGGVRYSLHPLFANGVTYVDFAFPFDDADELALLRLPLLSKFTTGAGTGTRPYDAMARLLSTVSGGFDVVIQSATPIGGNPERARTMMIFRLKALAENLPRALDAALELLTDADFGDRKRFSDLAEEYRNDVSSSIIPSGSAYASSRAAGAFTRAMRVEELLGGLAQHRFLRELGTVPADLLTGLRGLVRSIVGRTTLRVGITTDPERMDEAFAAVGRVVEGLPETSGGTPFFAESLPDACDRREAWTIPAGVGYSALCLPSAPFDSPDFVHESVLAHALSTGWLWNEIRVKGGAYGASARADGMERVFSFSSYRDPSPVSSLATFWKGLEETAAGRFDTDELERAVIGSTGRDLKPLSPEERGFVDFRRELYGIGDELRRRRRGILLATAAHDVQRAADRLAAAWERRTIALISGAHDVELMRRDDPATVVRQLSL
ncbi:MAG: insulinase family protein [Spirochaetes bacterium]|nr:insulinase family protein [Spirochaetota bacterium]